jgi:hypothetical protein
VDPVIQIMVRSHGLFSAATMSSCLWMATATASVLSREGPADVQHGRDGGSGVSVSSGDGLRITFGTKSDSTAPVVAALSVGGVDVGPVDSPLLTGFQARRSLNPSLQ